jgi:hypothetical protein
VIQGNGSYILLTVISICLTLMRLEGKISLDTARI